MVILYMEEIKELKMKDIVNDNDIGKYIKIINKIRNNEKLNGQEEEIKEYLEDKMRRMFNMYDSLIENKNDLKNKDDIIEYFILQCSKLIVGYYKDLPYDQLIKIRDEIYKSDSDLEKFELEIINTIIDNFASINNDGDLKK